MEWMDRYRRIGGWLWVALGLVGQLLAWLTGATIGPVTWTLVTLCVALALALARMPHGRLTVVIGWVVAVAFAADFLAAVADRFGLFGAPGSPGVSWGDWDRFLDYTAVLLHQPADLLTTSAAVAATLVEVSLAVALLSGRQRRWVGKLTAGLWASYLVLMLASDARADSIRYAMPVLIGGALLLSATPTRAHRDPTQQRPRHEPQVATCGR